MVITKLITQRMKEKWKESSEKMKGKLWKMKGKFWKMKVLKNKESFQNLLSNA